MKMSVLMTDEKPVGVGSALLLKIADVTLEFEKWGGKQAPLIPALSFCDGYIRQCLRLLQWEYLDYQVVPVSAYKAAMTQNLVVSRSEEIVDYGVGDYPKRSYVKLSHVVDHIEKLPAGGYSKGE